MKTKSEYLIAFRGLSNGDHEYSWDVEKKFFENFNPDQGFVNDAMVHVVLTLRKSSTMLELFFEFSGQLTVSCDRCLDDVSISIHSKKEIIVKEGKGESDDQIVFIGHGDSEIDLEPILYDMIVLEVPVRKVHPEGECNEEMINKLRELMTNENESEF